jgi:superfamily II DNA or RNA helicase
MRKIIDNEPKSNKLDRYTVASALNDLITLKEYKKLDIATGFFNLGAWIIVENAFLQLKNFRMIIGREFSNRAIAEAQIQQFIQNELDGIDIEKYQESRLHILSLITFLTRKNPNWASISKKEQKRHPELKYLCQIKIHPSPFLHGKCYLFPNVSIVGSSNFTAAGLMGNTELNLVTEDVETNTLLKEWFEYFFDSDKSFEYTEKLVELLRNSKFGDKPYDPYWVFLKIVFEYNKYELMEKEKEDEKETIIRLADFQEEGVERAVQIVKEYGGVLIADAVGLGKSFIGGAVVRRLCLLKGALKNRVLVICPAQLEEQWKKYLDQFGIPGKVYTQEKMSREVPTGTFDIFLVDESHNFRNPKPKRFSHFKELIQRGSEPNFVFLTATPINIGYLDLYYQLYLLLRARDTALSSILGIPNLYEYFKAIDKGHADVHLVTDQLVLARSRAFIRYRQKVLKQDVLLPNGIKIKFPDRKLHTIRYHIIDELDDIAQIIKNNIPEIYDIYFNDQKGTQKIDQDRQDEEIAEESEDLIEKEIENTPSNIFYNIIFDLLQGNVPKLDGWNATAFNVESYKLPDKRNPDTVKNSRSVIPLMLTTFLKRLEGSIECFKKSIQTQIRFNDFFLNAFGKGLIISSKVWRKYYDKIFENDDLEDEDRESSVLDLIKEESNFEKMKSQGMFEEYDATIFQKNAKAQIEKAVKKDNDLLKKVLAIAQEVQDLGDMKRECLKAEIEQILTNAENSKERKVIIFTFYEDTANYLYDYFCPKGEDEERTSIIPNVNIEKISGSVPKNKRLSIIQRFAPVSNVENEEERCQPEEEIDVLISTDVLSEGMNLQDAKSVINYDLHWNPVRMIQRGGRIDRLGSQHDEITITNFFLEKGLENLLGLMERIKSRLRKINETIELDAPVIDDLDLRRGIKRIEKEDISFIEEQEAKLEFLGLSQSKKELQRAIQLMTYKYFSSFPLGIYSGMLTINYSGLVVAMEFELKGNKRPITKWVFEPDPIPDDEYVKTLPNGIIDNILEVEKIIVCSEGTKRLVVEPAEDIYRRATNIIRKVRDRLRQKSTASRMSQSYEKGNKVIAERFLKAIKEETLEREYAERFLHYLQTKPFNAIRNVKEIKPIVEELEKNFSNIDEIEKLDTSLEGTKHCNQLRGNALRTFLDQTYQYFEQNDIEKDWKVKIVEKEDLKVILVGILRVYTKESWDFFKQKEELSTNSENTEE